MPGGTSGRRRFPERACGDQEGYRLLLEFRAAAENIEVCFVAINSSSPSRRIPSTTARLASVSSRMPNSSKYRLAIDRSGIVFSRTEST